MTQQNHDNSLVFIGSYASAETPGIYTCRFNTENGKLEIISTTDGIANPSFLEIDRDNKRLYTILEETNAAGERVGLAAAYQIDDAAGTLQLLNKEATIPDSTCHIALDRTNTRFIVSSYGGGNFGLSPILEDGRIGATSDIHYHSGSSIAPSQGQARAHSAYFDPTNQYAIVCDLGADEIVVYKLDADANKLIAHSKVSATPGAGPRHFVFHPTAPYGYVINELNATMTAYAFDSEQGVLTEIQTVPTLPQSYEGDNATADIHISPDGKFLYGSNRVHDSIVVYSIDPNDGSLTYVEHASTLGERPRNFAISPDGRFVLVANKATNTIVTFERDATTGKLKANGQVLEVSRPVCLKFLD